MAAHVSDRSNVKHPFVKATLHIQDGTRKTVIGDGLYVLGWVGCGG